MMDITAKISILLFIVGCTGHSHWTADRIHSEKKEFSSTKLSYLSADPVHGIDVELINIEERVAVYLNVHSIPVPPHQGNPKNALVKLDIDSHTHRAEAYRLEGGQRFLLPDEISKQFIEALQQGKEVTLSLPGYRSTVKAEDFSGKFQQFLAPSLMQNPFHLPM
jgi:hypothetical protein